MSDGAAPLLSFRDVLRLAVMRRLWYAQIVSLFGDFLAIFAVISVVTFRLHATPTWVTGVQIAYLLPLAFLGPLAGVFVDRWPLKPTLVSSDLIRAALVILLVLSRSIWQIYGVLAALSVVSSFFAPAQSVTIRQHVPRNGLLSANALMQIAMTGVRIVAPLTAGVVVAALGPGLCYTLDALSFVASAALIGSVAIMRRPVAGISAQSTSGRVHAIWHDMSEGMRFMIGHAAILFVVSAMAAAFFTVGCFGPLVAVFVRESLHGQAAAFGLVSTMVGVGLLFGTQGLRAIARRASNSMMVFSGLTGIGFALLLLAGLPNIAAALTATFLMGFSISAILVPAQTLLQQETPHALMGRMSSTVMSVIIFSQLVGLIVSAAAAQFVSVRTIFFLSAVLCVVLAFGGRMVIPAAAPAGAATP
jgi:DHA3 family macrolide efflux protein-like MFS transporter